MRNGDSKALNGFREGRQKGQAAVEFALMAPIIFLLIMGAFDFARLYQTNLTLKHAAQEGARVAAVHAECPVGNSFNYQPRGGAMVACPDAVYPKIADEVKKGALSTASGSGFSMNYRIVDGEQLAGGGNVPVGFFNSVNGSWVTALPCPPSHPAGCASPANLNPGDIASVLIGYKIQTATIMIGNFFPPNAMINVTAKEVIESH